MGKFKVGNRVKWQSQSGGHYVDKEGVIVCVVPEGIKPATSRSWIYGHYSDELDFDVSQVQTMYDGWGRNHESYLVEVKAGPRAKPRLYWPLVSKLNKV